MKKYLAAIIFILSLIALVISLRLFSNLGIYVDEHNTSPSVVLGGDFYLLANWLRLLLLALITAGSGLQLFLERNKE
ncbi:MAG: hypothetical protein IJF41_03285 [Clostridia bacterium]|nr:hypothetical protein [Clostridia bacterium]